MADIQRQIAITIPELPPTGGDYDSFIVDAVAATYGATELTARLRGTLNGYAANERGQYANLSRGEISYYETRYGGAIPEKRRVTPEQAKVITEVRLKKEQLDTSEKRLTDTASFLADVLSGKYGATELTARLKGTRNGLAVNERGDYANLSKGVVSYYSERYGGAIPETRSVSQEQVRTIMLVAESARNRLEIKRQNTIQATLAKEVLTGSPYGTIIEKAKAQRLNDSAQKELLGLCNSFAALADTDIVSNAIQLLAGKPDLLQASLEAIRTELADVSDDGNMQSKIGIVEDFVQKARRIALRSAFWGTVDASTLDMKEAFSMLETYNCLDDADRALVTVLRREALEAARDGLVANVYNDLTASFADFNSTAKSLAILATISGELQDPITLQLLPAVVKTVYSSELAIGFGKLVEGLTIDRDVLAKARELADALPIRPEVAGVNFFDEYQKSRSNFLDIVAALEKQAFDKEVFDLRRKFPSDPDIQGLVEAIQGLADDFDDDGGLKQRLVDELVLNVAAMRGLRPDRYKQLENIVIDGLRAVRRGEKIDLTATPERRNIEALTLVSGRFKKVIMPLFEALRGGENGEVLVRDYISDGARNPRGRYIQLISELSKQRDISDTEMAYLESVELLSSFNPHLVALAREEPELTSLYLEAYFNRQSAETKAALQDGQYIPLLQIGLGPSGLAAAGELARSNPELAAQALYIEASELPGGPFGVAKGLSWELNSANGQGRSTNVLSDPTPEEAASAAVRSYTSPLTAYPGERRDSEDVRQGSINVTVDWLLNPDNVSSKRYPTNVDLARVLQLQTAMLTDRFALSTRVTRVEPIDDGQPGNKIVTLVYSDAAGNVQERKVRTDSIIVSSGLGEPNFGIDLQDSSAEKILQSGNVGQDGFPLLSDTLGAFSVLSNPEGDQARPEGTIVIYGGGNSADVLIEYLGRQFESGNGSLSGINKVVVVTNAELSKRPRYAQINDLKSRNGQPNFLEVIRSRVSDVMRASDGTLRLIDEKGSEVTIGRNGGTKSLKADHVIAASGFMPELDEVFAQLLSEGESIDRREKLARIVLPNNPGFSIADSLQSDPSVIFVGTASRADFGNPNKLEQLPPESREAYLRNGGNAVAIGFRTPDTRAAVRITYQQKEIARSTSKEQTTDEYDTSIVPEGAVFRIKLPEKRLPGVRRDIDINSEVLTSLFLGNYELRKLPDEESLHTRINIGLESGPDGKGELVVTMAKNTPQGVVAAAVAAFSDPYLLAYSKRAIERRRNKQGIKITLSYTDKGRLRLRDKGQNFDEEQRTYIEAI